MPHVTSQRAVISATGEQQQELQLVVGSAPYWNFPETAWTTPVKCFTGIEFRMSTFAIALTEHMRGLMFVLQDVEACRSCEEIVR